MVRVCLFLKSLYLFKKDIKSTNFKNEIFGFLSILCFPEQASTMLSCAKHQLQVCLMCSILVQAGIKVVLEIPLDKAVPSEVNGGRC